MPKISRKSQAALEFLTTYAWAFLVIIIMIGALAYFGVLNPSKLLPDRCNFGSEITCNKDLMVVKAVNGDGIVVLGGTGDDFLTMRLKNSAGTPMSVTGITLTTDVNTLGICTPMLYTSLGVEAIPSAGTPVTWGSDETRTMVVECITGNLVIAKEKIKLQMEISYFPTASGSAYSKKVFGDVYSTIQ